MSNTEDDVLKHNQGFGISMLLCTYQPDGNDLDEDGELKQCKLCNINDEKAPLYLVCETCISTKCEHLRWCELPEDFKDDVFDYIEENNEELHNLKFKEIYDEG